MKVHASLKNLRIAPRKVRLVADTIVGLGADAAVTELTKRPRRAALPLKKLLESAIANATNNFGLDRGNLVVREAFIGDGVRLKRWQPHAFGRATPLLRRCSNVSVVLEEKVEGKGRSVVSPHTEKATKAASEKEGTKKKSGVVPVVRKETKPKALGAKHEATLQRKAI